MSVATLTSVPCRRRYGGEVSDAVARDASDAPPAADAQARVDGAPAHAASPASDAAPSNDVDGDGIRDVADNCPAVANPTQRDADGDGLGDSCDVGDSDGDGLPDRDDPCPAEAVATDDQDGDGVGDACDVCPEVDDPVQEDADRDGVGDACEIPNDDDADGVPDHRDNCPHTPNGDQSDADMDGVGTPCDICPADPDPAQLDGDGIGDGCDVCPAIAEVAENHVDGDGDGQPTCAGDCDDSNPLRAAGLAERWDEIDNDCDGQIDEGGAALGLDRATPFRVAVNEAIDRGLQYWRDLEGGSGTCGNQTHNFLCALSFLERRSRVDGRGPPQGYLGLDEGDRALVMRALAVAIDAEGALLNPAQDIYAYTTGGNLMALALFVATGGPDDVGARVTVREALANGAAALIANRDTRHRGTTAAGTTTDRPAAAISRRPISRSTVSPPQRLCWRNQPRGMRSLALYRSSWPARASTVASATTQRSSRARR